MKRTVIVCMTLLACALPVAPARGETAPQAPPPAAGSEEPHYEMAHYVVGFLRKGPKWTAEQTPATAEIQKGHMANIVRMAKGGKLVLAGPFSDDGDLRGMFVFQDSTLEEARALCDQDPALKAGRLVLELHPWYSAKGIRIVQGSGGEAPAPAAKPAQPPPR